MASTKKKVDWSCGKENLEGNKCVFRNRSVAISHRELEMDLRRYLGSGGVHLEEVGIDLWARGCGNAYSEQ